MASAHEYWLQAHEWQIEPGDEIVADIRVGQKFKGSTYSYFPRSFVRIEDIAGSQAQPVTGRAGDIPAIRLTDAPKGLNVILVATSDTTLTYHEGEKFTAFVEHKALGDTLERHAARGLPEKGFKEVYSRYAKMLVSVGAGEGADRVVGLETEIVALANPYTDDLAEGLPVKVLYRGAPRAGAQVELFERAPDGEVSISTHLTDAGGIALLPVRAGHVYMADAVLMREPAPAKAETSGAVWESLWANLTFAVPSR